MDVMAALHFDEGAVWGMGCPYSELQATLLPLCGVVLLHPSKFLAVNRVMNSGRRAVKALSSWHMQQSYAGKLRAHGNRLPPLPTTHPGLQLPPWKQPLPQEKGPRCTPSHCFRKRQHTA